MTVADLEAKLSSSNFLSQVLGSFAQSELAPHLRRYWVRVWGCAPAALFVLPDHKYIQGKSILDALTNENPEYDPVEAAGEEGSSRQIGGIPVALFPQATWDGFNRAEKQMAGTVVHEISHLEDMITNGAMLCENALFAVWQEFFAETVAAPFYDSSCRVTDLNIGMQMAAERILGFHAGIAQFGRLMGALNGWGFRKEDVERRFEPFGRYWKAAAVRSFPILQSWAETERRPRIQTLEIVLAPLFGQG